MAAGVAPIGSARLIALTGAANTLSGKAAPGTVITVSHGSATTLTLPESTTVNWEIGTVFFVVQAGAGAVTVAKTGSDTFVGSATVAAGDILILIKTTATNWYAGLAA